MSTHMPRRRFLQAIAAGAAPLALPAAALGREDRAAPSERITAAVIGCGKIAKDYHLPELLRMADVQVLAVCEVDQTRREHAKQMVHQRYGEGYRGCLATDDFLEVLERDDLDAACIATPDHWHALPIIEACRRGKDVYCEKPLTHTLLESRRCIEAVRKYKRVLQTGSQQRSSVFGPFRLAVEIVRSGRLGAIRQVTVGVGGPSRWCDLGEEPLEPGLNWDRWLGPAPRRPYHSTLSPRGVHNHFPAWRAYREYAGGGHADMGAHHYDIAQWALDMDHSGPVEIIPPEDPSRGQGVRYRYASGVEVIHGGPQGCVFTGDEGTLHIGRGVLSSNPESIAKEPLGEGDVQLYRSPGHHRNWIDCIKSRGECVAPVEAGARTAAMIHLGNLAYWHGRPLRWNPQTWQFVDDEEANARFFDYERRDPWHLPEA